MLFGIGADPSLVGITYHSVSSGEKEIIGGYFNPALKKITALDPDIVFYSDIHRDLVSALSPDTLLINLSAQTIEDSFYHINLLGRIFGRGNEAEIVVAEQRRLIDIIQKKTAKIPKEEKLRVIRIMGRDSAMVPGDDSFQNEFITLAGGIAPVFGEKGNIIEVGLEGWQKFNPQVIYGCGNDRQLVSFLKQPGWNSVDAVKNSRIFFFPCDLTCRASTHTGDFISSLSARLYQKQYSEPDNQVLPDRVVSRSELALDFDYIESVEKIESDIRDFRNRSVVIHFNHPMTVLSSLEGWRDNILHAGNHYFPPPSWGLGHEQGLDGLRGHTLEVLGESFTETALLFTGADMNNLSMVSHAFRDMYVTALVTAGVSGNALRMAFDTGGYYELSADEDNEKPGTINIMIFTNTRLSPRAMTRAMITATEAKSAALQGLDIRSSYSSMKNQATGTGTDNILIVQGDGPEVDASGGHTKMGELLAKAVYDGVIEAVLKQNGIASHRHVFQRLKERKISIWEISRRYILNLSRLSELETLLLEPRYQSYMAAAFAISDDYESGLITDLAGFTLWSKAVANEIGGKTVELKLVEDQQMPIVLRTAISAFICGINTKK